jgi:hypothetical protein
MVVCLAQPVSADRFCVSSDNGSLTSSQDPDIARDLSSRIKRPFVPFDSMKGEVKSKEFSDELKPREKRP